MLPMYLYFMVQSYGENSCVIAWESTMVLRHGDQMGNAIAEHHHHRGVYCHSFP
jgi:hypothetical protein